MVANSFTFGIKCTRPSSALSFRFFLRVQGGSGAKTSGVCTELVTLYCTFDPSLDFLTAFNFISFWSFSVSKSLLSVGVQSCSDSCRSTCILLQYFVYFYIHTHSLTLAHAHTRVHHTHICTHTLITLTHTHTHTHT